MDRDKDAKLTFDEFVEGSKQDPTIVQVRNSEQHEVKNLTMPCCRHCHYTTASYSSTLLLHTILTPADYQQAQHWRLPGDIPYDRYS